jgi:hypothetical protein
MDDDVDVGGQLTSHPLDDMPEFGSRLKKLYSFQAAEHGEAHYRFNAAHPLRDTIIVQPDVMDMALVYDIFKYGFQQDSSYEENYPPYLENKHLHVEAVAIILANVSTCLHVNRIEDLLRNLAKGRYSPDTFNGRSPNLPTPTDRLHSCGRVRLLERRIPGSNMEETIVFTEAGFVITEIQTYQKIVTQELKAVGVCARIRSFPFLHWLHVAFPNHRIRAECLLEHPNHKWVSRETASTVEAILGLGLLGTTGAECVLRKLDFTEDMINMVVTTGDAALALDNSDVTVMVMAWEEQYQRTYVYNTSVLQRMRHEDKLLLWFAGLNQEERSRYSTKLLAQLDQELDLYGKAQSRARRREACMAQHCQNESNDYEYGLPRRLRLMGRKDPDV